MKSVLTVGMRTSSPRQIPRPRRRRQPKVPTPAAPAGFLGAWGTLVGPNWEPPALRRRGRKPRVPIQQLLEVFNLFDRAHFGPPSLVAFSGASDNEAPLASFGQIRTTVSAARQVQVGIRVTF